MSAAKLAIFEQLARVAKALASPQRLALLDILAQGERPVEALAAETGQPFANASQHLQALREARLVERRRRGAQVLYRVADEAVLEAVRAIRQVAGRRLAELDRALRTYLGEPDGLEPVTRRELLSGLRSGKLVVLDVRPPEEFRAGHIRGAISAPLDELRRRLPRLPADRLLVAYCRGPYCVMAHEAVARLRARGRPARRLEDGFPEWKAARLPVEQEEAV